MPSLSEENYLKAIYSLSQSNEGKISLTAIAESLGNNPVSVIDMLRKLGDKKLLIYDKKKGAKLTEKGHKTAIDVVRKHRLWESFLVEKLGYGWDKVHEIAEQLEHVHDTELANRLEKFLGYPEFDPHGDPIPKANGKIARISKTQLSEIDSGKSCFVTAVKNTSSEFLQYLQKLEIGIGTRIKVVEKIPFDESVVIQIEKGSKTTISKKLSQSILVE
jgi:DtxR family Mn-dependent transcriptional regulator